MQVRCQTSARYPKSVFHVADIFSLCERGGSAEHVDVKYVLVVSQRWETAMLKCQLYGLSGVRAAVAWHSRHWEAPNVQVRCFHSYTV